MIAPSGAFTYTCRHEALMRENRRGEVRLKFGATICHVRHFVADIVSHLLGKLSQCDNLPHVTDLSLYFQIMVLD